MSFEIKTVASKNKSKHVEFICFLNEKEQLSLVELYRKTPECNKVLSFERRDHLENHLTSCLKKWKYQDATADIIPISPIVLLRLFRALTALFLMLMGLSFLVSLVLASLEVI